MPGSEDAWHPRRIAGFLAGALVLYLGLFLWSDRLARAYGDRNPFWRIERAPERSDWLILGTSHAMPLGFAGAPQAIHDATGVTALTLAATGAGPFVQRLVAERYFADHEVGCVLIVVDDFALADRRWNEERIGDPDLMAKVPADLFTLRVLAAALPRGLPPQSLADHATGFSRITDRGRFAPDRWEAEARFDSAPRPSAAADRARIDYLYPATPTPRDPALSLADLAAIVAIARAHGACAALLRPPLPDHFRALLPADPAADAALARLARAADVPLIDHAALVPEARFYLDSDHLNRAGVATWLERGLGGVLAPGGQDDGRG